MSKVNWASYTDSLPSVKDRPNFTVTHINMYEQYAIRRSQGYGEVFSFGAPEPSSQMQDCNKHIAILSLLNYFANARSFSWTIRGVLKPMGAP
jgi:hypothetical protein